jgi:hypothetical protein
MNDIDTKAAASSGPDLAQIERTLQASIKLMKRGRREMERLRRKPDQRGRPAEVGTAS